MVKKIAVEEHCLCPGFEDYWAPTVVDLPANARTPAVSLLTLDGRHRDRGAVLATLLLADLNEAEDRDESSEVPEPADGEVRCDPRPPDRDRARLALAHASTRERAEPLVPATVRRARC